MNIKTLFINMSVAVFVLVGGVMSVGAQDRPLRDREQLQLHTGEALALLEEYTGLSSAELAQAVHDGETIADLIEANGESVDEFVSEVATLAEARIDAAVENGRLTEERADALKERLTDQITARVNAERSLMRRGEMRGMHGGFGPGPMGGDVLGLAEEATGLSGAELVQAVRDGETIADLIEANGGDVDAFIDEVTVLMTENMRERVESMVNGEHPMMGQGRGFRFGN